MIRTSEFLGSDRDTRLHVSEYTHTHSQGTGTHTHTDRQSTIKHLVSTIVIRLLRSTVLLLLLLLLLITCSTRYAVQDAAWRSYPTTAYIYTFY